MANMSSYYCVLNALKNILSAASTVKTFLLPTFAAILVVCYTL